MVLPVPDGCRWKRAERSGRKSAELRVSTGSTKGPQDPSTPARGRWGDSLKRSEGAFLCLYGRRRLGKSRLIGHLLKDRKAVYYVGDERDASLQRVALAREMEGLLPGFSAVTYPDWSSLLGIRSGIRHTGGQVARKTERARRAGEDGTPRT